MTRRGFLALLGLAAIPATTAATRPRWRVIPAGFHGGFHSGFSTRRVRVR